MKKLVLALALLAFGSCWLIGQNIAPATAIQVQMNQSGYFAFPISSTSSAVNTQAILTIPAPIGNLYNYVCYLAFNMSDDASGATVAATNAVTTVSNFNGFVLKFSLPAANNNNYDWSMLWGTPVGGGCAKSTSPGTATVFTSPAINLHAMYTWYATYYQAP